MTSNQEDDPFDRILIELGGLVQLVKMSVDQPPISVITPEIFEKLARLEKDVAEFQDINSDAYKRFSKETNPQQMAMLESPEVVSKNETRMAKKLQTYQEELLKLQSLLLSKMAGEGASAAEQKEVKVATEDKVPPDAVKPSKPSPESRKNKFKPIGGNKKWIPL